MLIGIDGGGTKTDLCLADETGRILCMHTGEGTNPADIGLDACENRLRAQLDALLSRHGGRDAHILSAYAGIAGSANKTTAEALNAKLRGLLKNAKIVDNGSDAFNALYGEAPEGEGIALIAGTGSSAFALSKGDAYQVGGWGYLVDDAGSGFRIGADALRAAYRALDGRGEDTLLKNACEARLETPLREAIPRIYAGGKRYVASFAKEAFEAARAGDAVARDIIMEAARALAEHLKVCLQRLSARPAICVASGGLTNDDEFIGMIKAALGSDADAIRIIRPNTRPVYGALVKAARNAGLCVDRALRENFVSLQRSE